MPSLHARRSAAVANSDSVVRPTNERVSLVQAGNGSVMPECEASRVGSWSRTRALEILDSGGRIDAERVAEGLAQARALAERVGLPAAAVERNDLLGAEVLTQRLGVHPFADIGKYLEMTAVDEVGVVACFVDREVQLAQAAGRRRMEREVGEDPRALRTSRASSAASNSSAARRASLRPSAARPSRRNASACVRSVSSGPTSRRYPPPSDRMRSAASPSTPRESRHRDLQRGFGMLRPIVVAPDTRSPTRPASRPRFAFKISAARTVRWRGATTAPTSPSSYTTDTSPRTRNSIWAPQNHSVGPHPDHGNNRRRMGHRPKEIVRTDHFRNLSSRSLHSDGAIFLQIAPEVVRSWAVS